MQALDYDVIEVFLLLHSGELNQLEDIKVEAIDKVLLPIIKVGDMKNIIKEDHSKLTEEICYPTT